MHEKRVVPSGIGNIAMVHVSRQNIVKNYGVFFFFKQNVEITSEYFL